MSDPTDSMELLAAVSAILRAATMRSTADGGHPTGQASAMEIDIVATDIMEAGLEFMTALREDGEALAAAYGWTSATALSSFLAVGTRGGETLH